MCRGTLEEERFDQVIVDFDDPEAASLVLEACRRLAGPDRQSARHRCPVTRCFADPLHPGRGSSFRPHQARRAEQAQNTLRAATALLKRERRQSARVAVQAAVSIHIDESNASTVEGILLDLSNRRHGCAGGQATSIRGSGSASPSSFPTAALALPVRPKLHGVPPTVKPACVARDGRREARATEQVAGCPFARYFARGTRRGQPMQTD